MYQSKTAAWPHQAACMEWVARKFSEGEYGLLLALPMGVGKSKIAIDVIGRYAADREKSGLTTRILVLCPLSVVNVWPREFKKHDGGDYEIKVTTGKLLNFEWTHQEYPISACVVHYDAAWREPLASWLLEQRWNIIVADESHKFKAHPTYRRHWRAGETPHSNVTGGKLADFMARIGRRGAMRLALTGTPMAHSPGDIFSQIRFLDAGKRFGNSPAEFMLRYHPITTPGSPWVNQHDLSSKVNEVMWTCPPDVVELPEAVHETMEFEMGAEQKGAYKQMWRELYAEVGNGSITAANGAVRFLRLQQLTSGIAKLDDGSEVMVDTGKADLLKEFLDDIDETEKVVVFCQFRSELTAVEDAASATPGRRYAEISGERKDGLSADATFSDSANILGVQLQSGGVGIDLTAARYCVYFSPGMSLANYEQSLKRVWRHGQTRPVLFLHLIARNTVDSLLYKRLEERKDLVEGILELARQEVAA